MGFLVCVCVRVCVFLRLGDVIEAAFVDAPVAPRAALTSYFSSAQSIQWTLLG